MKFRNYLPRAKELQEGKFVPPAPPKFDEPVSEIAPQSDDAEVLMYNSYSMHVVDMYTPIKYLQYAGKSRIHL